MSRWLAIVLCGVVLGGVGVPTWSAPAVPPAHETHLLIPAYFYPAGAGLDDWRRVFAASKAVNIVAIVNPDSGPGKRVDDNYAKLFEQARGSKALLVGYVTLSYGKRPISAVKADIDSWLYFYPQVCGIFFDEQPSAADQAPFALECFAYARSKIDRGVFITNPGVPCAPEYLAGRDSPVACLYEHEKDLADYQVPEWATPKPADRFAVLIHEVSRAEAMKQRLAEIDAKNAAYLYITDASMPMPWGRLPRYWDELVEAVRARGPSVAK